MGGLLAWGTLGEVGLARVDDGRVGEHVDQGGEAGGESALQRGSDVLGSLDQLAVAAERLYDLVVARSGAQLGRDGVSVEELHRVLLERPDAVVAHHADSVDPVARERVELHAGKSERTIAEQQYDLAVGVR